VASFLYASEGIQVECAHGDVAGMAAGAVGGEDGGYIFGK
jgi:hypothetical protein